MVKLNVVIKKLNEEAIIPTYGSELAAGCDLYACITLGDEITISPHETVKIGTGLSFELPEGFYGAINARSGLAAKQGLRPANCTGICDEDYRGEYIVALHNDTELFQTVKHGDRIAQLLFVPYYQADFSVVDKLSTTERGDSGFGSTGK